MLVLLKSTACFIKNDVSFFIKWRVVFHKVTCCFFSNDRSLIFAVSIRGWGRTKNWFVKIPIISFSHAHAYTNASQEFLCFCCHKCHTMIYKTRVKTAWNTFFSLRFFPRFHRISTNFSCIFSRLSSIFHSFFICCVTLVTAKKQHYGWNARLRVRACKFAQTSFFANCLIL